MVLLCVVDRNPSLRPHTNKHVPDDVPRAFDVPVAQLGAEITACEGPPIALKICHFDRDDRPLHAHVLIRRRLRLRAQTESARALQQLSLSRPPSSYDSDLASRLVGIPNRNCKRPMTIFRNANDAHVNVGQKRLPFFLSHCERYSRPSRPASSPANTGMSCARKRTRSDRWRRRLHALVRRPMCLPPPICRLL